MKVEIVFFYNEERELRFYRSNKVLGNKYGIEIGETQLEDKHVDEKERLYEINREAARFFIKFNQ